MEEAVDKLWENRLYDEKVKKSVSQGGMDLNKIFSTYGIKDVFVKKRAACWINYANVDCDYYMWIGKKNILSGTGKNVLEAALIPWGGVYDGVFMG